MRAQVCHFWSWCSFHCKMPFLKSKFVPFHIRKSNHSSKNCSIKITESLLKGKAKKPTPFSLLSRSLKKICCSWSTYAILYNDPEIHGSITKVSAYIKRKMIINVFKIIMEKYQSSRGYRLAKKDMKCKWHFIYCKNKVQMFRVISFQHEFLMKCCDQCQAGYYWKRTWNRCQS